MQRDDLIDLNAFATIAEESSFTRAAARLGTSQSALSHALRRLEARIGVRLLTRTTRRVVPTKAGDALLATLRPALETISTQLASLAALRDRPAGTVRITAGQHAAETVLWPVLNRLLADYPDVQVEISIDQRLTDIVSERFDAGVRLGESLAKDMIAVPIGPELRMAVVASPAYLAAHGVPDTPQSLAEHGCINLRLNTQGGLYAWEFSQNGREIRVRVEGQLTFNTIPMIVTAAIAGFGLACVMEDQVAAPLADGRLVRVLADWCEPFAGYHLYYPSRRQPTPAFSLLVDALRRAAR